MKSRKLWTAALSLALMVVMGGHRAWAAGPERQLEAKMLAEGWTKIDEGVFERQRGATKVEHIGYGREGLIWAIGELTRWRESLLREYEISPSADLARLIENLAVRIAVAAREVRNMPRQQPDASAAFTGGSCGDICYGATADAYYLTNEQGVGAVADAKFNSACGFVGDTYAYAFARATLNGTTTTVTQEDPHTGTSVTSHAAAVVKGGSVTGIPCHSEANSYAQSTTLGISYMTSDLNDLCPVPPLGVTITGPTLVSFTTASCASKTWSATVTGGTPPYTYQWYYNSAPVGTASSYTRSVCYSHASFRLEVVVTDSSSPRQTARDAHDVTVFFDDGGGGCADLCCPGGCCFSSATVCP